MFFPVCRSHAQPWFRTRILGKDRRDIARGTFRSTISDLTPKTRFFAVALSSTAMVSMFASPLILNFSRDVSATNRTWMRCESSGTMS